MTLAELEGTFSNGFHDAELLEISTDFARATAVVTIEVDLTDSNQPSKPGPASQIIKIQLEGLCFLVVEPPDQRNPLTKYDSLWTCGCATTPEIFPELDAYRSKASKGTFFYSFFLNGLNSYIHFGANDAKVL